MYGSNWIEECMKYWDSIPNCQFWNSQWAAIIARVVKNYSFIDWECFLPTLFTRFLNMFEVSMWTLQVNFNYVRYWLEVPGWLLSGSWALELMNCNLRIILNKWWLDSISEVPFGGFCLLLSCSCAWTLSYEVIHKV